MSGILTEISVVASLGLCGGRRWKYNLQLTWSWLPLLTLFWYVIIEYFVVWLCYYDHEKVGCD